MEGAGFEDSMCEGSHRSLINSDTHGAVQAMQDSLRRCMVMLMEYPRLNVSARLSWIFFSSLHIINEFMSNTHLLAFVMLHYL